RRRCRAGSARAVAPGGTCPARASVRALAGAHDARLSGNVVFHALADPRRGSGRRAAARRPAGGDRCWTAPGGGPGAGGGGRMVLTVLAVTAVCSLVQFPYSSPIYFLYAAPLGALAAAAVVAVLPGAPGLPAAATLAFYVLFAVKWIHPGFIYDMGLHYSHDT